MIVAVEAHTPPDPPQEAMSPMSLREMTQMMQMDDTHRFGTITFDQLEWRNADGRGAAAWDAEAWYGGDYDKVWFRSEGSRSEGETREASAELLWDRTVSEWWNVQAGGRQDFGSGPGRTWVALGLEGVAPYGFFTQATFYVGDGGRTAARIKTECELYLTQRLIVQPKAEVNLYGKGDPARAIGSGLSDLELGVRVRYELRREFAPYVGIDWLRLLGSTSDAASAAGRDASHLQFVAGLRVWL